MYFVNQSTKHRKRGDDVSIQQNIDRALKHFNIKKCNNAEIHIGLRRTGFTETLMNNVEVIKMLNLEKKKKVKIEMAFDNDFPHFLLIIKADE